MKPQKQIAAIGEFKLIKSCFAPLDVTGYGGVKLGIGDDGALLETPQDRVLVVSSDTLVEGVHFSPGADPRSLGRKALRVNLSDLAAMGATPGWYLLSLSLPAKTSMEWVREFSRGLEEDGERFAVALVGGDTTSSKGGVVINVTVMGHVGKDRALLRSGAEVGDRIFVSGTIGDSTLGLACHLGDLPVADSDDAEYLKKRHLLPEPRTVLGAELSESALIRCAVDISDGLVADLGHVCTASGVGAVLDLEKIPFSYPLKRQLQAHGEDLARRALTGGGDYELLFTVQPENAAAATALAQKVGVAVTDIGVITDKKGVDVRKNGASIPLESGGWVHF